ncbi:hypothetical protein CV770_25250 [Bradyrhizobium sp. AC87j1]|nr:hypothetical protein CV770_25250 [Bradyrhizobium sp. AC87j1]
MFKFRSQPLSLTSQNFIGYQRAEFEKASRLRVALFFVQLAVAIPAAVSVVIPDDAKVTLYVLAIFGAGLLAVWWVLNRWYVNARSAAQAARRAGLLLGGLNEPLSPSEVQSLRDRFTISAEQAAKYEQADYYATTKPPGASRLGEMLEESSFYSEHLQRVSSNVLLMIILLFVLAFVVIALATTPFVERDTTFTAVRVFLAMLVFAMSADVIGGYQQHRAAAEEIKDVRTRLAIADRNGYPLPDVLLAMTDYNAAVEGAPEVVPFIYNFCRTSLDQRWRDYQNDREEARHKRTAS